MSCHVFLVKRNPQKHMLSLLHMLANSNSIWPASCFCTADTIRVNFIVLNGWKIFLKNISWHVKIIWNPDFCVYKHTFIGTKPRPFFNCRLQAAFATREELSSCDIKTIQIAKPKSCYLVIQQRNIPCSCSKELTDVILKLSEAHAIYLWWWQRERAWDWGYKTCENVCECEKTSQLSAMLSVNIIICYIKSLYFLKSFRNKL